MFLTSLFGCFHKTATYNDVLKSKSYPKDLRSDMCTLLSERRDMKIPQWDECGRGTCDITFGGDLCFRKQENQVTPRNLQPLITITIYGSNCVKLYFFQDQIIKVCNPESFKVEILSNEMSLIEIFDRMIDDAKYGLQ